MRKAIMVNLMYDRRLRQMNDGRQNFLDESDGNGEVRYFTLPAPMTFLANQTHFLNEVAALDNENGLCDALLILSHGLPNQVLLNKEETSGAPDMSKRLLSLNIGDEALSQLVKGKDVYLCACRVAEQTTDGQHLARRLIECGATTVLAFKGSPEWDSSKGLRLWHDIDRVFYTALAEKGGYEAAVAAQNKALSLIDDVLTDNNSNMQYTTEFRTTRAVVDSMVILEG